MGRRTPMRYAVYRVRTVLAVLMVLGTPALASAAESRFGFEVDWPERRVWPGASDVEGIVIRAVDAEGELIPQRGILSLVGLGVQGDVELVDGRVRLPAARIDAEEIRISLGDVESRHTVPSIPGWLSLAPALLAIALALLTRQVIVSLVGGIYLGSLLLGFGPIASWAATLDRLVGAAADPDHVKIMLFTLLMGGMVGVVTSSGGAAGIVASVVRFAKTPRSASITTWAMGMFVFFDDYASSLLVGNTMRPLTDDLKISREKLAYIVDSTAAPISSLAIVSTWIGYEVSVLAEAMKAANIERDAYEVFISGLPSRFYQILSLLFVLLIAGFGRDFGPMLHAERRARRRGQVLRDGAKPLMDANLLKGEEKSPARPRAWLAVTPIAMLVSVALAVLAVTGLEAASSDVAGFAAARESGWVRTFGFVLGNSASYDALLYGSGAGVATAILTAGVVRAVSWGAAFDALIRGIQAMMLAVMVLTLAWSIGSVMSDLHAGAYVTGALGETLPVWMLPSLAFVLAALIASATGTSWGTMAVLFPIVIPLVAASSGDPDFESIFLATASAILGGAVFGDHCSPISDTTVLSSIACASDHVDHTRTQAPYALLVGAVSVVFGYVPAGLGVSPWISLVLGLIVLVAFVRLLGKRPEDASDPLPVEESRAEGVQA